MYKVIFYKFLALMLKRSISIDRDNGNVHICRNMSPILFLLKIGRNGIFDSHFRHADSRSGFRDLALKS